MPDKSNTEPKTEQTPKSSTGSAGQPVAKSESKAGRIIRTAIMWVVVAAFVAFAIILVARKCSG